MKRRILYIVTEDWYFCSHRLPVARAARDVGYEVWVATRVDQYEEKIRAEGFNLIPIQMERNSLGPLRQLRDLCELVRVYRQLRPDLVHHVALKPVLIGSFAAWLTRVPAVVNAMAGLGFVFASETLKARCLRPFVSWGFRFVLNRGHSRLILQNADDVRLFVQHKLIAANRVSMIRGSGVDVRHFQVLAEPEGKPTVAVVARMLRDKGIVELVEAARLLRSRGFELRVILAGGRDPLNPSCLGEEEIRAWETEDLVEWWDEVADVRSVWAQAHLAVLPSYREGLPKSLLEAAACGRAMIATDVPGCREIVRHEITGLLVPAREVPALAQAVQALLANSSKRRAMAVAARTSVENEFAEQFVVKNTLDLYLEMTDSRLSSVEVGQATIQPSNNPVIQ
ncbi:MAG: glycosyltransferase family 4 protein [bacterium]